MSTSENLIKISVEDLCAFDDYTQSHPIAIDLVYAQAEHRDNIFQHSLYRPKAKLWGHKDMVKLTLDAARICYDRYKWITEVKDCLRPVEAQAAMQETEIVKANPHWMVEPRLLSPPGAGGHPRGMAVDIIPLTENGEEVDMGTYFDYLSEDRDDNPAARNYTKFSHDKEHNDMILSNRQKLTDAMLEAAKNMKMELLPLPQEWWDFRFMPAYTSRFEPIQDQDLPEHMRIVL